MMFTRCKKWGTKVGRVGNLTKNQRYSPLSHLYIPKKVGSKKHIEKHHVRITKKRGGEQVGNFKKWGTKVGSGGE
ncbi:hypothetical protein FQE90_04680 [Escherichia coli]|nr:hypothetical protein [Escherichia coli]TVO73742.1 hypothetical protein FPV19_01780 [Escherichia coli O177]EEW0673859.1 hypothetical protein [Escherichia coli]EEX2897698.1 hypothetical protein [Escherichia coli]EEY7873413.1 hypothetical protein [Escherichia coli]